MDAREKFSKCLSIDRHWTQKKMLFRVLQRILHLQLDAKFPSGESHQVSSSWTGHMPKHIPLGLMLPTRSNIRCLQRRAGCWMQGNDKRWSCQNYSTCELHSAKHEREWNSGRQDCEKVSWISSQKKWKIRAAGRRAYGEADTVFFLSGRQLAWHIYQHANPDEV